MPFLGADQLHCIGRLHEKTGLGERELFVEEEGNPARKLWLAISVSYSTQETRASIQYADMSDRESPLIDNGNREACALTRAGITILVCNLLLRAMTLVFNTQSQPSGGQPRHLLT